MISYQWTITTTGDGLLTGGEEGTVFLSLHGLDHQLPETQIGSPDGEHTGSFAKSGVASGMIAVQDDLGELQTGRLRTTVPWHVETVAVRDMATNRCWEAVVNEWADSTGDFPILRFSPCAKSEIPEPSPDRPAPRPGPNQGEDSGRDGAGNEVGEVILLKRRVAELTHELNVLRNAPCVGDGKREFVTLELVAMRGGRAVPLDEVLYVGLSGGREVLPGTTLAIGTDKSEGFGLGGLPGRWADYYPGVEPSAFGLPPASGVLGWAATGAKARAWAVPADLLEELLGSTWRHQFFD